MSAFTPVQLAELRDSIARSQLEARAQHRQRKNARKRAARRAEVLPPRSAPKKPPRRVEEPLADALMAHVSPFSVVDRREHALGVARLVLRGRRS